MFDALGFPTSITSSMVEGHMVNLRAVVSRLINKHTYGLTDNKQKSFWLGPMICGRIFALLWKTRFYGCLSHKCGESN